MSDEIRREEFSENGNLTNYGFNRKDETFGLYASSSIGDDPTPAYFDNDDIQWTFTQPRVSIKDPFRWYFSNFPRKALNYFISMVPILQWIHRYNLKWLYGDVVAGITVGIVVVPQGMSYAKVAGLPVQYGLYSSFIGVMLYCFFATSKDVSIGPVAVMSAETYKITHKVLKKMPDLTEKDLPMIASVLSLLCGAITMGLGLLRLGFLLEYIPMPAVLGFMTGSAFTIAVGQVPALLGIDKLFDTRGASYGVVIRTLQHLPKSNINAAFGMLSLFVLYLLKIGCGYLEKKDKKRKWVWFYFNCLRSALVIIFSTLISWGCYRIYGKTKIEMLGVVPRGLTDVGVHPIDRKVASALASELPIATVILVLEHIAISKSFGRINEYRVNPNQELIAIGVANLIGYFFEAYPNTGSFSRTALKSKCGVRTPLAGILTGACVLVAIYALTDAFYYISKAALAAIIIHAVGDLISSYQSTYKLFLVSPIECLIFFVDVILCVFVSLEVGLYFSFGASMVFLFLKQTFPLGEFLGKVEYISPMANRPVEAEPSGLDDVSRIAAVPIRTVRDYGNNLTNKIGKKLHIGKKLRRASHNNQHGLEYSEDYDEKKGAGAASPDVTSVQSPNEESLDLIQDSTNAGDIVEEFDDIVVPRGPAEPADDRYTRPVVTNPGLMATKWWPLSHKNINPEIRIVPPPPGIFVYRFRESLTYQNASWQSDRIVEYIRANTRRNLDISHYKNMSLGDRPWNEPGPRKYKPPTEDDTRPVLRAIVFDMSASPNVDMTGAQYLWDCHQEVTKYACVPVEFHFAGIMSPWSRRALLQTGFGQVSAGNTPRTDRLVELARTEPVQRREESHPVTTKPSKKKWLRWPLWHKNNFDKEEHNVEQRDAYQVDEEEAIDGSIDEKQVVNVKRPELAPVVDTNTCFFHFDIPDLELRPLN